MIKINQNDILFDDPGMQSIFNGTNGIGIFSRAEKMKSEGNCSSYVSVEEIDAEINYRSIIQNGDCKN